MDFKEEVKINRTDLGNELLEQSTKFAYWATLHAQASKNRRIESHKLALLRAKLRSEIWAKLKKQYSRPSQAMFEDALLENKDYRKRMKVFREAQYKEDLYGAAVQAFRNRKDMLVELARIDRETIQNEFIALKNEYKRRKKNE